MSSSEPKAKESKRKQVRYAVSDDCRLRASIRIRSSDENTGNKEWHGTLVDMSSGGAHIQISLGAVAFIGDSCVLKLEHGGIKTELRGTLAHYVCSARHSVCGVRFDYAAEDKIYQRFFKAIVASGGLAPDQAGAESAGRYREEFRGPEHAKLVVWRDKQAGALKGFEYTMARFGAALDTVGEDMLKNKEHVHFRNADGAESGIGLSKALEYEARLEFSIAASNLPKTIAPDIRRLLRLVS